MKLVPLTIEALGPLAFPERKPGVQFRSSLPYIPGATIYGALGQVLGAHSSLSQAEIGALLRAIRCHNAYPAFEGDPWSRPVPASAMQPKGEEKVVCDSLYGRVCWEEQQPTAFVYAPTGADGRPWEGAEARFYTLNPLPSMQDANPYLNARFQKRQISQRVLTRVAINRHRATAEYSRLYSPLVLSEVMSVHKKLKPSLFLGSIAIPEQDRHILPALEAIQALGGRQSSGLGSVAIRPQTAQTQADHLADLKKRIELMSQRFAAQARLYQAFGGAAWRGVGQEEHDHPATIFTINLLSDAILHEQGWLPSNQLSASMLLELTGIAARLLRSFSTTTTVGGWHILWQHPKQTNIATRMGSLFVFQAATELQEQDYQQLLLLEQQGIGERRSEGFGQVRICDEFHLLSPKECV